MSSLSKEDKDIILDFYFRCGDEESIDRGRDLVAANPEAAVLYAQLEESLTQLDSIKYGPCPENLVELTVARLKLAASSGQTQLHKLLILEQQKDPTAQQRRAGEPVSVPWSFRENLIKTGALAAGILIVVGIAFPTLSGMRQRAWRTACENRLRNVGAGFIRYAGDNDGRIPYVATTAGTRWSRGDKGSNTRHPFLLGKLQYVKPQHFVCPGNRNAAAMDIPADQLAVHNDFPSINNFPYSFRIMCDKSSKRLNGQRYILMSDLSPVFESLYTGKNRPPASVVVDKKLIRRLSSNHRGRGQNILRSDGSVEYITVRFIQGDDIFTINGIRKYERREIPCDEKDTFLAP
ncbi:MAG: hypothetical protein DRP66_08390 [Planctomycetota bacterium]|nr:MAG: hypothetical protein DRP66_08390 [Planctomycetota bacterium]